VNNTLETYNLSVGYNGNVIQRDLNLKAAESSLISLIGTNGTGKSTLLRSLASLQPVLGGNIHINGQDISHLHPQDRAKKISVVLTDVINVQHLSVFDLVAMGRMPYTSWSNRLSQKDNDIVMKAIENVNLAHKTHSMVNELSDGERQRASIARALAQDTPLILLDEPTSHLDLPNRVEIMLLLRRLADNQQKTIIISTHELNLAFRSSHQIWLLSKESPILCDIPSNVIDNPLFQSSFTTPNFNPKELLNLKL